MKKSKLKKRSKSKATIDKADRALQDFYRRTYPNEKCEICGAPFNVMHHHLRKSESNAGRYHHDNLVFICTPCHTSVSFGNMQLVAIYSAKRGKEWVERMTELKKIRRQSYGKKELEKIIKIYL